MYLPMLLLALASVPPPAPILDVPSVTVNASLAGHPDYYQYRVGFIRKTWRTDYPLHTIVLHGDTLAKDLTRSQLQEFVVQTNLPESAPAKLTITVQRFDQAPSGQVKRGPYPVKGVEIEWLEAMERRTNPKYQW